MARDHRGEGEEPDHSDALAPTVLDDEQRSGGKGDTVIMADENVDSELSLGIVDPDHYEAREEMARGGMGVVTRAHDRRIGREVALKELLGDQPGLRRRFEREARVTGQLQHPAIVPVYEIGCWPDGRPFYAMKLVQGRPLDDIIDEALDDQARLALIPRLLPAIEAMAYAHDRGVIHRDLKPANILLSDFGETVVIDWGLAKVVGEEGISDEPTFSPVGGRRYRTLTEEGAVMGTPAYMPPEQATGAPLDARADVYSLGALMYHTVSGRAPYDGESPVAILAAVLDARSPPSLPSGLPPDLVGIIEKSMATDPHRRYADASELARDLKAFSTGRLVGSYHYSSNELLLRFVRRNRALSASLLGLLVVAVVGSAVILVAYRTSERQRLRALEAEKQARREEGTAHERLAQMHANDALQRLLAHDHLGAELFAAAALVEQPANPASPYHALFDGLGAPPALIAGAGATWAAARALRFAERGRELPAHDDWVYDVVPSADGRWVVTAGADRVARVWNVQRGELHATLDGHEDTIFQVALSEDGRQLATSGYDGTVRLWSFPDGDPERTLDHPTDRVYGICYASDGSLLAAGTGGVIAFFDPTSGELTHRMDTAVDIPWRMECARDHPLALLASKSPTALLIDVSSRTVAHRLEHENGSSAGGLLTPDGLEAITTEDNGLLRRFDTKTGASLGEVATGSPCRSTTLSTDGRWLALGGDSITVLDRETLRPVARLRDHRSTVTALAFDASDHHLYSGSLDHRVLEWSFPDDRSPRRFVSPSESDIDSVELSPDGATVIAAGDDGAITTWNRMSGELIHRVDAHAGPIRALRILDGEQLVSAGVDRTMRILDRRTHEVVRILDLPHFGDELSLHPDGDTLALGRGDGSVVLFDTSTWSPRWSEKLHEGRTWWVGFNSTGSLLGTASFSGEVVIVDPETHSVMRRWQAHETRISGGAWHPSDHELVTIDFAGWVRAWDPASGEEKRSWRVLDGERLNRVAFAPDATQLLITSRKGLRLYTLEGNLTARLDLGPTTAASWTEEGSVVVGTKGEVLILPLEAGAWRVDPRHLVGAAEEAAATNLNDMMGLTAP